MMGFMLVVGFSAMGQFIDHYGIRGGMGLSNHHWKYKKGTFSHLTGWKKNKTGLTVHGFAERKLSRRFSLRSSAGYSRKGYRTDFKFIPYEGEEAKVSDNRVIFHELSLDLSCKYIPFGGKFRPYLFTGLQGNYLVDQRNMLVSYNGKEKEIKSLTYDNYNNTHLRVIAGAGISYNELLFLDFEYNPNLGIYFESSLIKVTDKYFTLTMGINIDQLITNANKSELHIINPIF